jgi:hypothetical protein
MDQQYLVGYYAYRSVLNRQEPADESTMNHRVGYNNAAKVRDWAWGSPSTVLRDQSTESGKAEHLIFGVVGSDQTVAVFQGDFLLLVGHVWHKPQGHLPRVPVHLRSDKGRAGRGLRWRSSGLVHRPEAYSPKFHRDELVEYVLLWLLLGVEERFDAQAFRPSAIQ